MTSRYGHSNSIQAAFENISKDNFSVIIDCDLQDSPELIAKHFNPKERKQQFTLLERRGGTDYFKKFTQILHTKFYI